MTAQEIKDSVLAMKKGVFTKLSWGKTLKTLKKYSDLNITKKSNALIRFGCEYSNLQQVKNTLGENYIPQSLPWGEWSLYPYFIKHKDKEYLRAETVPNNHVETEYFLNGKKVNQQDIIQYCQKSEFNAHSDTVFNLNFNNIISIGR